MIADIIRRANAQGFYLNQLCQLDDGTWRANFRGKAPPIDQPGARVFTMVGQADDAAAAMEAAFRMLPKGEDLFD